MPDPAPIPVHLITGPLGVGKTTAIARLLADKPRDQAWLVILNEFTDTGIDALTLAAAAQGAYDLRMIPGGCLCCTGEADFRQQLSAVLAGDPTQWPARILIEPSGIGHPGAVVEELRLFERSGALRLQSTIVLLDIHRIEDNAGNDAVVQMQLAAADVLLLAKADLVNDEQRKRFTHWAQNLFPPKRFVGISVHGMLPAAALQPPTIPFAFELQPRAPSHQHAHEQAPRIVSRQLNWAGVAVQAAEHQLLERSACGWVIGNGLLFDAEQLRALLEDGARWQGVERFKGVLRTAVDQWHLLHRWSDQFTMEPFPWRPDSRIEVQLHPGMAADWDKWDLRWQGMAERCPVA